MLSDVPNIRAWRDFSRRIICLTAFTNKGEEGDYYVQALEYKQKVSRFEVSPVMCNLDDATAQRLIDDLWDCGLRPSEGSGSAGALAATQKHLEDMRAIVANKIGVIFK